MYSVSEAYLPAFRKLYRTDRITGRIKLKNGTNIILSNEMLVQGGFTITRKVCGSSYDIGTFNAGEVSLSLRDDAAKELDFGGAVMAANYELVTGGTADNPVWETVPLGVFYIDGQQTTRRGKNITLRGFDGTSKFDIDLPLLDSVTTLWDGLVQACLRANVGLAVEEAWFKALPNADITPNYTSKKIQSCRDLVMWIAQTVGCCAFIDRSGFLQLKKYHYNGDGTFNRAITAAERTKIEYTDTRTYLAYLTSYSGGSPKLYTDVRQWTGTDTIKEGGLSIPNNPLLLTLTSEQQDAVNQALMSESSYPTRYIKSTGFVDPAIDLMDVLAFTGGTIDIGQIISVCTEIKWKYRGSGHVICNNLDQYSQDADSADAANAMTLSDDGTAAQSETTPAFMPAKSQLEKRVDALEAAGSGGGTAEKLQTGEDTVSAETAQSEFIIRDRWNRRIANIKDSETDITINYDPYGDVYGISETSGDCVIKISPNEVALDAGKVTTMRVTTEDGTTQSQKVGINTRLQVSTSGITVNNDWRNQSTGAWGEQSLSVNLLPNDIGADLIFFGGGSVVGSSNPNVVMSFRLDGIYINGKKVLTEE